MTGLVLWTLLVGSSSVAAQTRPPADAGSTMELLAPQAIDGQPFGVFVAEVEVPPGLSADELRILVSDTRGRIFYPATTVRTVEVTETPDLPPTRLGRPGGVFDRLRTAINGRGQKRQVPVALTVVGLYKRQDAGPLEVSVSGDINETLRIVPQPGTVDDTTAFDALLRRWWQVYSERALRSVQQQDFPKLVHQYLLAMLSQRLELPRVDLTPDEDKDQGELDQPLETLALLSAIEPLRDQILEDVLSLEGDSAQATLPLPAAPNWSPTPVAPPAGPVQIEEIATRVPPECFYLRFGSFKNFVWFQDLAQRYGGDLAQAVLLRGFNYGASARVERMLAAKMTQLAKMFGDNLISDLALVSTDLYMQEGASLGVIFEAKNITLLANAIEADRKAVARQTPGASVEELTIRGRRVLLLSTPDNRVRSFFVSDGRHIFISTSRALVNRFLEVADGAPSLADQAPFQSFRSLMPNENQYSVFAYLSPEFFHHLVSPQYQIELRRRLEAIAHLEIAGVASQAARAEGVPTDDLQQLQAAGLLPEWFDRRVDGSQTLRSGDQWIDSLRGARGSFLPIADVEIQGVTPREAEAYERIARFYQSKWKTMDPLVVGVRRFQAEGESERETVAFEAYISPFDAGKYGWIGRQLGSPTPVEIQMPADDAVSLQVNVRGNSLLSPQAEDYHLFAGIKDMQPPKPEEAKRLIKILQMLSSAPAYLGAWPMPGLIDQLPLGLGQQLSNADLAGFSRMLGGLWRWHDGTFSVLSFDRDILEDVVNHLEIAEANDVAQARLRVADLSNSQLSTWINNEWYERGWRASHANARLLDEIHQQLKVPAENCLDVAQSLLDVTLQCPLGGDYRFVDVPTGQGGWWESSGWSQAESSGDGNLQAPSDYQAPWIGWFRGGRVHVTQGVNDLAVVGRLDLEMEPLSIDFSSDIPEILPKLDFDVFRLPMQLFNGGQPAKENEAATEGRMKF